MSFETKIWGINKNDALEEIHRTQLDLEDRIENWLDKDISILSPDFLVIGRQVETDFGGKIDLLCIEENGDIIIVELKRAKTPRDVVAQTLDYASWVEDISAEKIKGIADEYLKSKGGFEVAFKQKFDCEVPDVLNESHKMLIVASDIDSSTERIVKYLSDSHGVNINAATFNYFKDNSGREMIARVFLLELNQVESSTQIRGSSKRLPRLTTEELQKIADDNGVGKLYSMLVDYLPNIFSSHRTRSSTCFTTRIDSSKHSMMNIQPPTSSLDKGLYYWIYEKRFAQFLNINIEAVREMFPAGKEYSDQDEPWASFSGYFKNEVEIKTFLDHLTHHYSNLQ